MKKLIAVLLIIFYSLSLHASIELTQEEEKYITENPKIEIGLLDSFAPFSFYHQGAFQGYIIDLLSIIEQQTGLKFKQRPGTWNDIFTAFEQGHIPLISSITKNSEREKTIAFSKPFYISNLAAFTRNDFQNFKGDDSLIGKKIGIVKNVFYTSEVENIKDVTIKTYVGTDSLIQALSYGWIDVAIMMDIIGGYKVKEYDLPNIKNQGNISAGSFRHEELRFGAKKDNSTLISIINKSLATVPKTEHQKLIKKWLDKYEDTFHDKYSQMKNDTQSADIEIIKDFLSKDLYNVDTSSIEDKLKKFIQYEKICTISVTDALSGKVFVQKNNTCGENKQVQTSDIYYNGEKVGTLTITTNDIEDKITLTEREKSFLKNHPIITVGSQMDYEPFDFAKNGSPAGFSIDYLKLLQKKIPDINFNFINGYHWNMLTQLFEEKKVGILLSESSSLQSLKRAITTPPYLELYSAIATRQDTDINSIESLSEHNKTLAVVRGFDYSETIAKRFPNIKLFYVTSPLKALKAVLTGQADAYIDSGVLLEYLVKKYFLNGIQVSTSANLKPIDKLESEIAIRSDWSELKNILQKAMEKVSESELDALRNKWFGEKFEQLQAPIDLNDQERAFLQKYPTIKVTGQTNLAPLMFFEDKHPMGLSVDMMTLLSNKIGVRIEYTEANSYAEELGLFKNKQVDLLLNVFKNDETEKIGSFSYPYFKPGFVLAQKKDSKKMTSLKELGGKILAIPKNYAFYESITDNFPQIKILNINNTLEALHAIEKGEADAAILIESSALYYIQKNFLSDIRLDNTLKELATSQEDLYFLTQKKYPELLSLINKAITSISPSEMNHITSKWIHNIQSSSEKINLTREEILYLRKRSTFTLCTGPDRMPFVGTDEQGDLAGIASDFMKKISAITGIDFKLIKSANWDDVTRLINEKKCDAVPLVAKGGSLSDVLNFTSPYIEAHAVYITGDEHPYIAEIKDVKNKLVAMPKGYPITEFFKKEYPNLDIKEVENYDTAFEMVANKQAHMSVDFLMSADNRIKKLKLYDLKFAGNTPYEKGFSIGISKNEPELFSIIQKAVLKIDQEEIDTIIDKWVSLKFEYGFDYTLFWKMLGITAVVLLGIFYWNYKLAKLNREIQRKNKEVITQKDLVEKKNNELEFLYKQISDSINYATYIQRSFLPSLEGMKKDFEDLFVIWEPRDKVGGDLYFYDSCPKGFLIAVIDCTGHGVPGGFMTMIVGSTLRRLREEESFSDNPAELLQYLNIYIKHQLNQSKPDTLSDDGLDIAMCYINRENKELTFAGAKLPLVYIEEGEMHIIKGNGQSIGYKKSKTDFVYTNHTLSYKEGRTFYLLSDGVLDQTGGKKGFPFGIRKFKNLLLELQNTDFTTQGERVLATIKAYQGDKKRRDDLTFLGFKL